MQRKILLPMLLLGACQQSDGFEAGMWATDVSIAAGGRELWSSKVERCIDPASGDPVLGILSATPLGPCTADPNYPGGTGTTVANCMGRPGSMMGTTPPTRVLVTGSRTATAIDGTIEAELIMEPQSAKLTGKLTARRTGDC